MYIYLRIKNVEVQKHFSAQNTFQSLSFSNLGSLVTKKLRELRNKEDLQNLTVKTKVIISSVEETYVSFDKE